MSEEHQTDKDLSRFVIKELAKGTNRKNIIKDIVKRGWSEESAIALIDDLGKGFEGYEGSPERRQVLASKYKWFVLAGFLWVVAVVIFLPGLGIVWYLGLIFVGIVVFLRGIRGWLRYKD